DPHPSPPPFWGGGSPRPRDYYRIEDEDGHRYWIFRDGLYQESALGGPSWYLHGVFGGWPWRRPATPSSTSPPTSPSCAAARIPRSWWRRRNCSVSMQLLSPIGTRSPAWYAPISPQKRWVGSSSSSACTSTSKMLRACSLIRRIARLTAGCA